MTEFVGPTTGGPPDDPTNAEYRAQLIKGEAVAQAEFDKTVVALSGSALGVTFAFLEKLLASKPPASIGCLKFAWGAWVVSLASILVSHYFSALAMRRAIHQHDSGNLLGERVGGWYDWAVLVLNPVGGLAFIAGAIAAGIFVVRNV